MTERDEKILNHIGLYRISINAVLEKLFFEGNESACENVVHRLRDEERIKSLKGLPGGKLRYYQLKDARPLGPRALEESLAVLWFSCMGSRPRHRLDDERVERLLGQTFQAPHCIEKGKPGEKLRIYRVYVNSPESKLSYAVGRVKKYLDEALSVQSIAELIEARSYAFAVLTDGQARRKKLDELIGRHKLRNLAHIIVETTPTTATLQQAIDRLGGNEWQETEGASSDTHSTIRRDRQRK